MAFPLLIFPQIISFYIFSPAASHGFLQYFLYFTTSQSVYLEAADGGRVTSPAPKLWSHTGLLSVHRAVRAPRSLLQQEYMNRASYNFLLYNCNPSQLSFCCTIFTLRIKFKRITSTSTAIDSTGFLNLLIKTKQTNKF